ncbi:MAG: hypothetical protein WA996_21320 [Candidatus Promineifilaceae bacterium]
MSKKRSRRSRRKRKAPDEKLAIPDPRAMEKLTADISHILSEQEFESMDEAKAFLDALLATSGPLPSPSPRSPLEKAQDLVYEAWEANGKLRLELAREALDISEDCADAWVLLAEEAAGSLHEARVFYDAGVRAGERALGREAFEEYAGHFWGVLETRPYMRARAGLAQCLWNLDKRDEAIDHLQEMLRLNPGDNQGIRYVLLTYLLEEGPDSALEDLMHAYGQDTSAVWYYSRALLSFRNQGASSTARKHLQEALRFNPHVPAFLLQARPLPFKLPDSIGFGDEDEAVVYVADNGHLWQEEEGAVDWMRRIAKTL